MIVALGFALLVAAFSGGDAQDSLRAHRDARRAQTDFERIRRNALPSGVARLGDCPETVGRFCYYGRERADTKPPVEPPRIAQARSRLLAQLREVSAAIPGDGWVTGQFVRYLIEAGDTTSALSIASTCSAETWWCAALTGYARQASGDYAGAESAFATAMTALPSDERCQWEDLTPVLSGALRDHYASLPCENRELMNQRIWWLAQPLWMRPVNDLRTEHYARQTMVRLEEAASSAYGLAYGEDARELTLRYGWSEAFSMDRGPEAIQPWDRPVIIGHNRTPSFQFFPSAEAVANPLASHQGDWNLRAARTAYAPMWAHRFADVAAHVARFRRGDSALVVAAFEVPDPGYHGRAMERLFVLSPGDGTSPRIVRDTGTSSGAFTTMSSWSGHLVGVELFHAGERKAARLRSGLAGRDELPILSDLLLFQGGDEEATTLTSLVPHAISGHTVRRDVPLGLYWEGYGLDVTDPGFSSSLELRAVEAGGLRRVAEALRLTRPSTALRLSWSDWQGRREEISARTVEVDVSTLPPGRYLIQVVVASAGREIAQAGREITIRP